jgi:isopenicillin N synthase-like dioxygenase
MSLTEFSRVPVIDIAPLVHHTAESGKAVEQIGTACRECGFFYIAGHGVDEALRRELEAPSRRFFDQSESVRTCSRRFLAFAKPYSVTSIR